MRARVPVCGSAVALLFLFTTSALAANRLDLRLRLAPGERYRLHYASTQESTQTLQEVPHKLTKALDLTYAVRVEKQDDAGNLVLLFTHEAVRARLAGPTGGAEYDSADPTAAVPPFAAAYASLIGRSFLVTMTPRAAVVRTAGVDAMLDGVMESLRIADPAERENARRQLAEQFGEKAIRAMLDQVMAFLPDRPVAVGEAWSRRAKLSKGFPVVVTNTYTLEHEREGVATLRVFSGITPEKSGEALALGPIRVYYDVSGREEGAIEVAVETGLARSIRLRQTLSGTVTMRPSDPQTADRSISWPLAMETRFEIEIVRL